MENSTENIDGTKEKVVSITKNGLDKSLARDIVRPLNIPCQSNSDRRNPITPELKF